MTVTIRQIAKAAGVSRGTVDRVLWEIRCNAYKGRPLKGNVIKLRRRAKNQEQEQVIEKIARSFFARKREIRLDK